jgi:hypothetical protein
LRNSNSSHKRERPRWPSELPLAILAIRSNGDRELGSRSPRTRCGIARLQRFAFVASCPSNQFALSGKCYAVLQESSAPRADELAIWDTLRSRKPGSLRAMPSQFETSCAI